MVYSSGIGKARGEYVLQVCGSAERKRYVMTPFMQLLLTLAIIIGGARLAALISTRLGQPALLGELLAGLVLGPSLLDMFSWPWLSDAQIEGIVLGMAGLGAVL